MINHFRTLLLNEPYGSRAGEDYPGEEYTPPEAREKSLTGDVAEIWQILFGGLDRAGKNLMIRIAEEFIFSTDMRKFWLKHDQRVTYPPNQGRHFSLMPYVRILNQSPSLSLTLFGLAESNDQTYEKWFCRFESETEVLISTQYSRQSFTVSFTPEPEQTPAIELGKSKVYFRAKLPAEGHFEVETLTRPKSSCFKRLYALTGKLETLRFSFFVTPEYRDIWQNKTELIYRYPAVLLQLVDWLEKIDG